jgi:predicted outer membrane lipoprotein
MERKPDTPPLACAYGTIGAMILRFSSMDEMLDKMDHMHRWVKVKTRPA